MFFDNNDLFDVNLIIPALDPLSWIVSNSVCTFGFELKFVISLSIGNLIHGMFARILCRFSSFWNKAWIHETLHLESFLFISSQEKFKRQAFESHWYNLHWIFSFLFFIDWDFCNSKLRFSLSSFCFEIWSFL